MLVADIHTDSEDPLYSVSARTLSLLLIWGLSWYGHARFSELTQDYQEDLHLKIHHRFQV